MRELPQTSGAPAYSLRDGGIILAIVLVGALALLAGMGWPVAVHPTPITDLGSYFLPKYQYAADRIAAGELPLWNPYEFEGIPFLATSQPAVFYPPLRLTFGLWHGEAAYVAAFFLHIALGAGATLLLMRSLGARLWPSVLSSLWVVQPSFVMRGWDHPVCIFGPVWIPLLLLLVRKAVHAPDLRTAGLLALVAAAQFTSGYPPMVLATSYILLLSLPFFIGEASIERTTSGLYRSARTIGVAAIIATLLVAVQLLPVLDLALTTERSAEAATAAEQVQAIAGMGNSLAFWMGIPKATIAESLHELVARFGPLSLGLCAAAMILRWRSAIVWLFVATTVFAALLPLRAYHSLPFYDLVRYAAEWDFIAPMMLYVLAGLGLDGILDRWPRLPKWSAAAAAIGIAGFTTVWDWTGIPDDWKKVQIDLEQPMPSGLEECDLEGPSYRGFWAEGQLRGSTMRAGIRSISGYEQSLIPLRVKQLKDALQVGNGGIDTPTHLLFGAGRNISARVGLRCVVSGSSAALQRAGLTPVRRPNGRAAAYLFADALPRARLAFSSRVASSPEEALSLVASVDPNVVIVEEEAEPLDACPASREAEVHVIRDHPEQVEISVDAPCPAYLVLADTLVSGWGATIDGASVPIQRADYSLRAVRVPAGRHEVTFRYDPAPVRVGSWLSMLGLLLAGIAIVFGGRSPRQSM